jgi:basic membrane protein A and related proteins
MRPRARRVSGVMRTAAVLAVIMATGCTSAAGPGGAGAGGKKVCELLQGSSDAGLNRAVQRAVATAHTQLGVARVVNASNSPDAATFLRAHCDLIVAAGYQQTPAILATAARYPRQRFLIADGWFDFNSAPDLTRRNVSMLAFEADQASFLAGYVAAAVSPNHVVGEYGSANIPTVDVALNGFLAGARAWGEDFRTRTRILGWNGSTGPFVENDFDQHQAFSITSRLIQGGAHVIFGVAGNALLGSAAAAVSHRSVYLVGMYGDGYLDAPRRYASEWLTSVVFDMRAPILAAVRQAASGTFSGGLSVGTVSNGGVALAPFHRLGHLVPRAVLARLPTIRRGLAQGWVSTNPADYIPLERETGSGY